MIVAKWGPSRKDATFCTARKPPYLICDSLRQLFREDQQGHESIIGVNFSRVRIILWEMKIHFCGTLVLQSARWSAHSTSATWS
jgi:hypothetical protein